MAHAGDVTVGIDIGTSSVKAVAADADGNVLRRARVPHTFAIPTPDRFQHDARVAWFDGPRAALDALSLDEAGITPKAVSVAAMVPSLTAVDDEERPIAPGLLYGDERGRSYENGVFNERGELGRFLASLVESYPQAAGYRPAQSVANAALTGAPVMSTTAAAACWPLFDFTGWSEELVAAAGGRVEQMPTLVPAGTPAGEVRGYPGCVLEGGTIDAMGEQIVAGAYEPGDVLVICGTTLIVWSVVDEPLDIAGYFPIPHTTPGRFLIGGPSNAGGLFLNWAASLLADAGEGAGELDIANVPLWVPYPRGERVPINDPTRRAEVHGLDLTHGPRALRRAAFEAAGFVTRRMIEVTPQSGARQPRRIVATGGGVAVGDWLDALATCTGLPVDVVAVPEGAALGAAFGARLAAGLETSLADGARWARIARTVEPDAAALDPVGERYERWLAVSS